MLQDKKLCLAAILLPVTMLFAGAAAVGRALPTQTTDADVPAVSAIEGETYAGILIELPLAARDTAHDVQLFQLTEQPRLGTAVIEGDTLRYTPGEKTGTDKFSYTAVDAKGSTATPARITIRVTKNRAKRTYADMEGDPAHYAALRLAEAGVMEGETISGCAFFRPTQPVTRSEFIAMATALADLPLTDTVQTDFADDSGLSRWAKPFVSTAAASGLVSGYVSAAGVAEIRGQNPITLAEACTVTGNLLLQVNGDMLAVLSGEHNADMDWAQAAVSRMTALDLLPQSAASLSPDAPLDRRTVCALLYQTIQYAAQ